MHVVAAPAQDVQRDSHVDTGLGERPGQEFIRAGEPAQQRVAMRIEARRGARGIALFVNECPYGFL